MFSGGFWTFVAGCFLALLGWLGLRNSDKSMERRPLHDTDVAGSFVEMLASLGVLFSAGIVGFIGAILMLIGKIRGK